VAVALPLIIASGRPESSLPQGDQVTIVMSHHSHYHSIKEINYILKLNEELTCDGVV